MPLNQPFVIFEHQLEPGGSFASGVVWLMVMQTLSGRLCTLTTNELLTHGSASQQTSGQFIPQFYRPPLGTPNKPVVYSADSGVIRQVAVGPQGRITFNYWDFAGAPSNQTDTGRTWTLTWRTDRES